MKVIVAGSRTFTNVGFMLKAIDAAPFEITEVLSGGCRGPDQTGAKWAAFYDIPVSLYPADWNKHGKAAGPIRNKLMADQADALIVFWDGKSRGTKNMIQLMERMGKPVELHLNTDN